MGLAVDDVAVDDVGGRRGPTSLSRGEGHRLAWTPWLGAKWGGEVVVAGRREDEPSMRLMLHSNSAPTPKKALDLSAYEHY